MGPSICCRRSTQAVCLALLLAADAVAAEKVPDVVVGPASAEAATRVDAGIAEVTVFSDRARIRRRGRASLKPGVGIVRFPDLPGGAFLDSVRVSAKDARVLRVEASPVERPRASMERARTLLDELDKIDDRLAELRDGSAGERWELDLLARVAPAPPVPEEKREGRKGLEIDVASWGKALDFLAQRATTTRTRLAALDDETRTTRDRRAQLQADLRALNGGAISDRHVVVVAAVDSPKAGPAELELEYFVPGAQWKPSYDLHFSPRRGQLRVETAAQVQQTTGEDWSQAVLLLSTAIPGHGIDLPELLTWTVGERSELIPTLRPREPPRVEPTFPVPVRAAAGAPERIVEAELLQRRMATAMRGPETRARPAERPEVALEEAPAESMDRAEPAIAPSAPSAPPAYDRATPVARMAPPSARPMMSRAETVEADEEESFIGGLFGGTRAMAKSAAPSVSVPLPLLETTAPRRRPLFGDPTLPAVSAGGLDYIFQAPTPATIPSTGKAIRIPLAAQTFPAGAFHEATPALAKTAFLRARVRNDGKRPLLRGPAAIFSEGELVGQGELQTTGPGGEIAFPLGADQDIRLERHVVPSTRTTGLIMKSEETTYDVSIQVGNYKKQPATVEVVDQVPRAARNDIEIKLLGTDPAPLAAPDPNGVIKWRVQLPAGGTRAIKLRYVIVRPKDWKLYQR